MRAVPIVRTRNGQPPVTIGVLTRHTNLGETRTPSRQQITFNDCADDLFGMVASGEFPDLSAPTAPRRGAPRASDGLIRLDVDGDHHLREPERAVGVQPDGLRRRARGGVARSR